MNPSISVIITTYNRPDTLHLVLLALNEQTEVNFNVSVADDGSTETTKNLIQQLQTQVNYSLQHQWQADQGFRAAAARNLCIRHSQADYIIFLDGDTLPRPDFIAKHRYLAETQYFVSGNRILCDQKLTQQILDQQLTFWRYSYRQYWQLARKKQLNRFLPLCYLPLGLLRKSRQHWRGVISCNLGVWRKDLERINGYDESFQGWGYEDADLALRLMYSGIKRKEGRFAVPVLHLWHPDNDRSYALKNRARLKTWQTAPYYQALKGLDINKDKQQ